MSDTAVESKTNGKSNKAKSKTEETMEVNTESKEPTEKSTEEKVLAAEKTEDKKTKETETRKEDNTEAQKEEEQNKEKADIKTDKTEPTDLEKKVIKQLEFYFGDVNLGRDKFMQGVMKEDNGWVKLDVLLTFNRLRSLSEDATIIVQAMGKATSGLVQISDDKSKLRRDPDKPLPEFTRTRREDLKSRSVYAKGFSLEMGLEELEAFFEAHGAIEHIQLRRDTERKFKGSVFVLFRKVDDAKKFVEAESIKSQDSELTRHLKDDYFKLKVEEKKSQKEENLKEEEEKKKEREDEEKESFRDRITKGSVLHVSGLPNGLTVDELRTMFGEYGEVAWVEYQKGDPDARIRYMNEDEAGKALEKAKENGEVMIKDTEVKAHVLEGDEEIEFWKALFQSNRDRKAMSRRGKRGRGGRGYGRGGPPNKKRRTH